MTIAWRRAPLHPALQGLSDDQLRYWRGDHVVASGEFTKASAAGWLPLVDSGGLGGLRWSALMERAVGRGTVLLCQMRRLDKLATEPVAQLLLEGLLQYAATRRSPPVRSLEVVADPESALVRRLQGLGLAGAHGESAEVIVVDASQTAPSPVLQEGQSVEEVLDWEPGRLQGHLHQGGTVLLHGLTPENRARWTRLLPSGLELQEVNSLHALRGADHPLLEGISPTDLWWSDTVPWERRLAGGVAVAYAAQGAANAVELVAPGALVAVPVGEGLLVLDQMQWDSEEVHPQRSGQYVTLLLGNLLAPAR